MENEPSEGEEEDHKSGDDGDWNEGGVDEDDSDDEDKDEDEDDALAPRKVRDRPRFLHHISHADVKLALAKGEEP